jgi:Ca2+-binding EF-hand superfamily protein
MKQMGEMFDQDWKDRPEWGDLLIAILKDEPMEPGKGWWRPSAARYDWGWLRKTFDADTNEKVDRGELSANLPIGQELFARLDRNLDDYVSEADFAPEASDGPTAMAGKTASMLFSRLDIDSNGRVSPDEMTAFFNRADSDKSGYLTAEDLRAVLSNVNAPKSAGSEPTSGQMLRMLFSNQLGWLEEGPALDSLAPDFTLPLHQGNGTITLSHSRGNKPVVLIFGSFT